MISQRVEFPGQLDECVDIADVAVHAKHRFTDNHPARVVRLHALSASMSAQVIQIAVAVAPHPTPPQNRPLDQAVVAESVEQDERAPINQRRQQRNIGLIAGIEHQRPLGLLEPSQGLLHLGKARLGTTDQARAAVAPVP